MTPIPAHGPPPETVRRILSAGPVADVLLVSLAPEKLIGLSSLDMPPWRRKYLPRIPRDLPGTGRLAGRGSTLSLERIVALRPDIVVDAGDADTHFISTLEQIAGRTGIPCVIASGRLPDMAAMLRDLGERLGVPERGQALADFTQSTLAHLAGIRERSRERPRVYLARSASGLETALGGSIHAEAIEHCGAINVAAHAGQARLARVSMEQLVAWAPDIIVTQSEAFFQAAQTNPLFQALPAVKQNRLYLSPSLPWGWLESPPGINRLLGLIWMTRIAHGAEFPDDDYTALLTAFFRLFYGCILTDRDLADLNAGVGARGHE
ncbi:ABC transporter substrate-binding protein [Phaeovibrio sulfidiphilus]|uniref:ABC transporter substrate-binding protein n=1 Tax=Phaeovibrio sulfidiphilus TaxID=1220600 RepID=A0A8J6YP39_9PROT|nr:ABC transporter substrate-binding protein [Phaeovibrio sulfidiphilus]